MLSSLGLGIVVCLVIGIAIAVALAGKARAGRTDGTIARVLYDAEHPEERR